MWKYIIAWFVLLFVAVGNGALRDLSYGPYLPELLAQQLSTLIAMVLLGVVIWGFARRYSLESGRQAISIGLLWTAMTVAFEFLFFHFVAGHSWSALFANYKFWQGHLWPILLLWIAMAPYVFFRLRVIGRKRPHRDE